MRRSLLTERFRRIKKCGCEIPRVRSINRLKKARPGMTTEHAKFSRLIKDWSSLRVTFLRVEKLAMHWMHLLIFSWGKRASQVSESNSMPANVRTFDGPNVFSGAMGMPRKLQSRMKRAKCALHTS